VSVEREELRLITSEAELRVGMLVELRSCLMCRGAHRFVLVRPRTVGGEDFRPGTIITCLLHGNEPCGWWVAGDSCVEPLDRECFGRALPERRLYEVRSRRDDEAEQQKQERLDRELAADLAKQRPAPAKHWWQAPGRKERAW
jgi:hypothetical protein